MPPGKINERNLEYWLEQDEDAAILAGRIGVAIADPITWVLPWAKVAKAGKIASMAMGAGPRV